MPKTFAVTIVDDHPLIARGVQEAIETSSALRVTGKYMRGADFLADLRNLQTDVVLLDLELPDINGHSVVEYLREHYPDVKVVLFTSHTGASDVRRAIQSRVNGYCAKNEPVTILVSILERVAQGESAFSPIVAAQIGNNMLYELLEESSNVPSRTTLTPQLNDIARLLAEGHRIQEIEVLLGVSRSNLNRSIRLIYKVYGATSRADFVRRYVKIKRGMT